MPKNIIDEIAMCQWFIDYWQWECKNTSIDCLDLEKDLITINDVLTKVLELINNKWKTN